MSARSTPPEPRRPRRRAGRPVSRRVFGRWALLGVPAAAGLVTGCSTLLSGRVAPNPAAALSCATPGASDGVYDYIVVGSGAGGGPLAANLARAGHRVLLLEAGGDDEPDTYQVPAFHALATEDERLRWDYFVRHYADQERQQRDAKYVGTLNGIERRAIYYPRASTLGGCTAHNAMITVYPHNSDWDHIAALTGDVSWRGDHMRRYFERLERCQYVRRPGDASDRRQNPGRHGFDGWLATSMADARLVLKDRNLLQIVKAAATAAFDEARAQGQLLTRVSRKLDAEFDPNDWRSVQASLEGLCLPPLATERGRRNGPREYIRRVQAACPANLAVRTHALATRVLFGPEKQAIGVEYLAGTRLYRADRLPRPDVPGVRRTATARREVILAAGAFNTPQLLKLSGVGPADELGRHGIATLVDLPGVGENLQDRYEIGVVLEMARPFSLLEGATFRAPAPGETPDPLFREWQAGKGPYTTNGAVIGIVTRSAASEPEPDLFLFGLAGRFQGYVPGYSEEVARDPRFFTWAILKAHTRNTAGRVALRSSDPRDPPEIAFHYFDEGTDRAGVDLEAVVDGVEHVRRITRRIRSVKREVVPGDGVRTRDEIRQFVRDNAWGHHASCTCRMGPPGDRLAVVDSRLRVHGVRNLRVVDASVFPRIPGFFIATSIYMLAEKATDLILADAGAPAA